jgi:methylmalonyl-CoA/ethylmalonyl-CoA epimerase
VKAPLGRPVPILGVDQVSVAVEDLDDATRIYEGILGLKATHDETIADQGVKTRFFPVAKSGAVVEALLALGPDTPVGKFLAKRGPGVHHIAFRVDDLDAELARLKRQGVRLIDETPRKGAEGKRIAFIHPKETGGVLIELCEGAPHPPPAEPPRAARKQPDTSLSGWTMHGTIGRTS